MCVETVSDTATLNNTGLLVFESGKNYNHARFNLNYASFSLTGMSSAREGFRKVFAPNNYTQSFGRTLLETLVIIQDQVIMNGLFNEIN